MRRVGLQAAIFFVPFALFASFIALTDPFDLLGTPSVVSEATRMKVAAELNPTLWKMGKFLATDDDRVLLGDSRLGHIDVREIERVSGRKYFNFWYGGGTLREMLNTFWFATHHRKLKEVVMNVAFSTYNDNNVTDRSGAYEEFHKAPALYFFDWTVFEAAYYGVSADWFRQPFVLGVPRVTRNQFWNLELDFARNRYRTHAMPGKYKADMQEMARYCRTHGIVLTFIILPGHIDLQNEVGRCGLSSEYLQFKSDMAHMAVTYDCDYPNSFTAERRNFIDPFHFTTSAGNVLIEDLWGGDLRYCRILHAGEQGTLLSSGLTDGDQASRKG